VIGLFMKNWHDESVTISNDCPWLEDSNDAMIVSENLGIPFQTVDLSKEYKERIVDYMFDEYKNGRTPNPDILCNREIKFDIFLKTALSLGADFVATGHYCRKEEVQVGNDTVYRLLAGVDDNKDQSYFLCQLSQEQLKHALFPIGELQKPAVRDIAKEADLITAEKKDSQGLCFVGKIKLPEFLQQKLEPKEGVVRELDVADPLFVKYEDGYKEFSDVELQELTKETNWNAQMGKKVGDHRGAHFFTVGQRKGMNIGGTPLPLFVLGTDVIENVVYTGQGGDHPGLYRKGLFIKSEDVHFVREDLRLAIGESKEFDVRIRYRQDLVKGMLFAKMDGVYIVFEKPIRGIAKGQFAVWYEGDELIGSGVIS